MSGQCPACRTEFVPGSQFCVECGTRATPSTPVSFEGTPDGGGDVYTPHTDTVRLEGPSPAFPNTGNGTAAQAVHQVGQPAKNLTPILLIGLVVLLAVGGLVWALTMRTPDASPPVNGSGSAGSSTDTGTTPAQISTAEPSPTAPVIGDSGFRIYSNSRYGFTAEVPAGFQDQSAPADRDGMSFRSPDGTAEVRVYGENNSGGKTTDQIRQDYTAMEQGQGGTVTFQTASSNGATVTGTLNGTTVFYYHIFVGQGSLNVVHWTYAIADKSIYDDQLSHSVHTFGQGDLTAAH